MQGEGHMISVYFDTEDPYSLYGLHHFIQKYGFPFKIIRKEKSQIDLIYGNSEQNIDLNIQIKENEIKDNIMGWIKTKNESAPLFETPSDLILEGDILVLYSNGKKEYPCIVQRDNNLVIGFGIFKEIGHILHGYLENLWASGNIKKNKISNIPIVDIYEKIMFNCLYLYFQKHNLHLFYKSFWPDGQKFAVCLTHDVDRVKKTFQYLTHTIKHFKKGEIGRAFTQMLPLLRRENPYWNFDRIIEIEKKMGVKSTFFFLNEQGKASLFAPREWELYFGRYDIKDPEIIKIMKRLDAEGWEIGIHGSYNSYRDLKMLEEEKNVLEELIGKKVQGISQHYCNLENPKTWEYHEQLGLAYDSTIGFVGEIGFRYGTCFPFHPFNAAEGRTLSLWEFPLTIMDNACSSDKRDAFEECIKVLNIVEKYNGVLLLRWHQKVFNEHEFPGRLKIYEKLIKICKEKDAWITTAGKIEQWYNSR
jgi:peptidoglycan/xylan/chitin deacetylase (PgdA/CDA1 family)